MKRALKWFGTSPSPANEASPPPPSRSASGQAGQQQASASSSISSWGAPSAKRPNTNNCYRSSPSATDDVRSRSFTPTSPSSLTHSPSSLSPSPQLPATPPLVSSSRASSSDFSHATSKPIPIATPTRATFSRSPSTTAVCIDDDDAFDTFTNFELDQPDSSTATKDVDMTAGSNYGDSSMGMGMGMGRSRQDSFVSAGPKPISMINPNRDRARRESLAGSLMGAGGISWGGISVGSFIRDE